MRNKFKKGEDNTNFKHGMTKSREYKCWVELKQRCNNPKNERFESYGGRGIKVCDRWKDSFINFYSDMGSRPEGMSIDRIDVNGDYEPNNCRWANPTTQSRNQRPNKGNKTGLKGINLREDVKGISYRVRIGLNGKVINIGSYKTIEEAIEARNKAELKYWG